MGSNDEHLEEGLSMLRQLVAKPMPDDDPAPAYIGGGLFVGNKHHAANVPMLQRLGVTAILNCAPSGIRNLPFHSYEKYGIEYTFTNVAQDAHDYPILHSNGVASEHFMVALTFYDKVCQDHGKALFFCVAGQNRSATLAVAVRIVRGEPLRHVLTICSQSRPFVLENTGFQRQLVELELMHRSGKTSPCSSSESPPKKPRPALLPSAVDDGGYAEQEIVVELLVPGIRTFNVSVLPVSTIEVMKASLLIEVNEHLESTKSDARGGVQTVGASWLVFTMFGAEASLILEEAAVEPQVQVARINSTFGLRVSGEFAGPNPRVHWNSMCRFELVVFSLLSTSHPDIHTPFIFCHQERAGAPGTLLSHSIIEPYLRAWDFVTGEGFRSKRPIVFSFSTNPREKRDFMNISTSEDGERQQFNAPGEGGILGMGNNAIVHHVELERMRGREASRVSSVVNARGLGMLPRPPSWTALNKLPSFSRRLREDIAVTEANWNAAVKRQFSLHKMLASISSKAEAGVAKRLRMVSALNRQGRLLYFYGLGIALAANNNNHDEYRFEATLLSQYQEDFSAYTLKSFMDDYTRITAEMDGEGESEERSRIEILQLHFSLMDMKLLLVSLLNGFRDLTLSGLQAFDFNHLNNVLVSRDYRKVRLIDIDGQSKGSIQFCADDPYVYGKANSASNQDEAEPASLHKPALDIDLCTMLPMLVQQLLIGKGRGKTFVTEQVSKAQIAVLKSDDAAKAVIRSALTQNFFPDLSDELVDTETRPDYAQRERHLSKVVEWFFALLMRRSPWVNWTNDIYDAMRCIDHLPIS